ncbi:MAG: hypothetical protein Q9210_005133 [Variospora velana]
MPYTMRMSVDGACRRNGYSDAVAAAAVAVHPKWDLDSASTRLNQAAELTAIIRALEQALDFYQNSNMSPYMRVTIMTDSKYAHGSMTDWVAKWMNNGWLNCNGNEVANRDLIETAVDLQGKIERDEKVEFVWVSVTRTERRGRRSRE